MRKSYGQAYLNMAGTRNADEMLAWPSADIGFMDPNVAVNVVYGVTLRTGSGTVRQAPQGRLPKRLSAYDLASIYSSQFVIDPRETRRTIARLLEVHSRDRAGGISRHQPGQLAHDLLIGASMFEKVVVANRGAAAARIVRALDGLGVKAVALYFRGRSGRPLSRRGLPEGPSHRGGRADGELPQPGRHSRRREARRRRRPASGIRVPGREPRVRGARGGRGLPFHRARRALGSRPWVTRPGPATR